MNIYKIISMLLLLILVIVIMLPKETPLPPISDTERWGDLNNIDARNRFCQAMGYDTSKIGVNTGFGNTFESDYAGSPHGYNIVCKRSVPESKLYSYEDMKLWMLKLEFKGNRT